VKQVDEQIERLGQLKQRLNDSLQKCRSSECQFEKTVPSCICK
jgi:hypothetical protein